MFWSYYRIIRWLHNCQSGIIKQLQYIKKKKNIYLMMFRDVTVVYCEKQNNQYMGSVGKMKSFLILKQVVCKITTVFSWVKK